MFQALATAPTVISPSKPLFSKLPEAYVRSEMRAVNQEVFVARDIAAVGLLQAATTIRKLQEELAATENPQDKILQVFATGGTQWIGLTTMTDVLNNWGKWDAETKQALKAVGVDICSEKNQI